MDIMHVENMPDTRKALADLLGVADSRVDSYTYISTEIFPAAEARLRSGTVRVLILDLGLNPAWDNQRLSHILRRLALNQGPLEPRDEQEFYAYRLARLAHGQGASCALLTNYPQALGLELPQLEALRDAFHAKAVFHKDEEGVAACAAWVRQELGLDPRAGASS